MTCYLVTAQLVSLIVTVVFVVLFMLVVALLAKGRKEAPTQQR